MNRTFKVVFNKARGALMVANEATCSVQKKGAKTVVAVAAALIAGGAVAQEAESQELVIGAEEAAINYQSESEANGISGKEPSFITVKNGAVTVSKDGHGLEAVANVTASYADNTLTLKNGTFSNFDGMRSTVEEGGGKNGKPARASVVTVNGGKLIVDNVTFTQNNHETSHARGMILLNSVTDAKITNSEFSHNNAGFAAGIDVVGSTVNVQGTRFVENESRNHAGAVRVTGQESKATFTNVTFERNVAALTGGAIEVAGGEVVLTDVDFNANVSNKGSNGAAGGAIAVINGKITGENVNFTSNVAGADQNGKQGNGGAIAADGTGTGGGAISIDIVGGSFVGNNAASGGALFFNGNSKYSNHATFTDVDFKNNTVGGMGGAIRSNNGTVNINAETRNVVITGNTAGDKNSYFGSRYDGYSGGFMALQKNAKAAFSVAEGRTITIGQAGVTDRNVDSITSTGENNTITKTGAGDLVVNSNMEAFVGTINVEAGSMTMANGFGTYSIADQIEANSKKTAAKGVASSLTVGTDTSTASAKVKGTWNITGGMTVTAKQGSSVIADNVVLGEAKYFDLTATTATQEGQEEPAAKFTTNGKLTVAGAGSMTVGNLTFTNDSNSLTVDDGGSLYINGEVSSGELKKVTVSNKGTIYTDFKNLAGVGEEGNFVKTAFGTAVGTSKLVDDSIGGTLTVTELDKYTTAFSGLVLLNAALTNDEGGSLTFNDIASKGVQSPSTVVTAAPAEDSEDVTLTPTQSTVLANVEVSGSKSVTVATGTAGLTLAGNGGTLFGADVETIAVTGTNGLTLGYADKVSSGKLGSDTATITVGQNESTSKLTVAAGSFSANDVDLAVSGSTLTVNQGATFVLNELRGAGTATIDGTLNANVIAAETTVQNGGVLVLGARQPDSSGEATEGGADQASFLSANNRAGDGEAENTPVYEDQIQGPLTIEKGSVLTTEGNYASVMAAAGFDKTQHAGLYIDKTIGVNAAAGKLLIGTGSLGTDSGSVVLGSDAFAVVNVSALNGEAAFVANSLTTASGTTIVLDNITSVGDVTLVANAENTATATLTGATIETTSALFKRDEAAETPANILKVVYNDEITDDSVLNTALGNLVNNGTDAKNMNVLNAIANKNSGFVVPEGEQGAGTLTAAGVQATKEYLATPVTAGTYNMAYDSAELISNALIQHNLNSKQGLGVWADVFYGSNETDTLYGNSGYSSDIYGGMIGVDYGFGEGARVGAALSIGSGDGDSEGSVSKYSTDSDFWGLSVYAGKDVGGLTFTADMSYLWLDNDISGSVAGASASESLDSTVFTLGARADWKAYEGDVMQVVPHVGVRWAQIDVDDYRGLSMDKMNVFEMPIGVTVKGNIATASGWTVTPAIDFTAAPQIGDTEVETIVGDVDVIDNVYNASIGVSAGNDAMRFGLSYKYGFGNDGRSNNTFNLKASYLF